jgi:small Trp-rich protein
MRQDARSGTAGTPSHAVRPPAAPDSRLLMHSRDSFRSRLPMPFVWAGLLLIVLKWFELEPVANWSWWAILAPLAIAFAWFEMLEPLLGFDKRQADDDFAKMRQKRIQRQFPYIRVRPRGRAAPKS